MRVPSPAIERSVHALLEDAAAHYRCALRTGGGAQAYLRGRGIGPAAAARFGLGHAREAWRDLGEVLRRHAPATVEASGLVAFQGGAGASRRAAGFDRFRGRIMFPIRDRAGALAGFGGRLIGPGDGAAPKYLNSPEGPTFRKRELLYGLFEAASAIETARSAVVVEGYLDVVALAQAGIAHCVGTLGTACTAAQLAQVFAIAARVVFCFDGDAAGRRAAARALETVLPLALPGRSIDFMFLPQGHDPDSFVREFGGEGFDAQLQQAVPLTAYLIERVTAGCALEHAEGRVRCASRAQPYWRAMPPSPSRNGLLHFCAGVLRIESRELEEQWRDATSPSSRRIWISTAEPG